MSAVALHHAITGPADGAVLLLSGSLGTALEMWDPQLPALEERHRVIRIDHRGHGASPAPLGPYTIADLGGDVIALLDRLGLDRVDYCGLSIGGMVGQWLAVHAPERIGRLALICTSPDTLHPGAFRARAQTVRAAGGTEPVADAVMANWFTEAFAVSHPDVVARYRDTMTRTPAEGYAGCCEAVAGHDVSAGLPTVGAPTLVIAGAQDRAIPAAQGARIAAAIPGGRLEILDPASHLASVERADTVTTLLKEHFDA